MGPAAAVRGIKPHASRTSTGSTELSLFVMASLLSHRPSGGRRSGSYRLEVLMLRLTGGQVKRIWINHGLGFCDEFEFASHWDGRSPTEIGRSPSNNRATDRKSTRMNSSHLGMSY